MDSPGSDPAQVFALQTLADLAVSWGRVGLVAFGGGSSMVPLMKTECVDLRGWMSDDQFLDALALGNALPGPIAAKMSVYVGLQVAGWLGALVAFSAVMGPPAVMMLGLAGLYFRFRERPAVAGAMEAVKPVVVGMLFWTAIDLFPSGVRNVWSGVVCALACLALVLKVHPALVIVIAMAGGALLLR